MFQEHIRMGGLSKCMKIRNQSEFTASTKNMYVHAAHEHKLDRCLLTVATVIQRLWNYLCRKHNT